MYKILLRHHWLAFVRSPGFHRKLAVNIALALGALYFAAILVLTGILLPKILEGMVPHQEPASIFNGSLIYIVMLFLLMRYFLLPLTTLNLQYYQALPIKRDTLINYLILKPLIEPVNYITLFFVIPFAFSTMYPVYGMGGLFRFTSIMIFLIWFNSLLAPLLKRKFSNIAIAIILFISMGIVLLALESSGIFSLFQLSQHLFGFLLSTPFAWLSVGLLIVLAYLFNKRYFAYNYYPENFEKKAKKKETELRQFSFMERYGKIGEIISLELKLIFRHKQTKRLIATLFLILLYGLWIYTTNNLKETQEWLFIAALVLTGGGTIVFGQWIMNWDGAHFDFLMTKNIDTRTYIMANYYMLLGLNIITFIVSTPYFLFGKEIIMYHLVAFVYNIGVNIYIYLIAAVLNPGRLDLSNIHATNNRGFSYKNFIIFIPAFVIPIALIMISKIFSATHIALIIIGIMGLLGIFFQPQLLKIITQLFLKRKYALCEEFRK